MNRLIAITAAIALTIVSTGIVEADPILNIPAGTREVVTDSGCADEATCPYGHGVRSNYYWSPSRTVVIATGQRAETRMHEYCHAHQHEAVRYYLGREPGVDLTDWYATPEFGVWQWFVGSSPMPWERMSAWTPLEDFAHACGLYFTDPARLWQISPERYYALGNIFGYW